MDLSNYPKPTVKKSGARTAKEALIEQIVEATGDPNPARLARLLAVTANTLGWTEQQLHILYQKRLVRRSETTEPWSGGTPRCRTDRAAKSPKG